MPCFPDWFHLVNNFCNAKSNATGGLLLDGFLLLGLLGGLGGGLDLLVFLDGGFGGHVEINVVALLFLRWLVGWVTTK